MRGRCRYSSSERTEDMYQDTYVEQVVKKVLTKKDYTIKNILMALTIFFGLATVFAVQFHLPDTLYRMRNSVYRKQSQMETEYEYLYVGGTMEIDKVIRQSRRKQVLVMDLSEMLVLAPEGSQKALAYDHGQMSVMQVCQRRSERRDLCDHRAPEEKEQAGENLFLSRREELLEAMHNHCPDRVFSELGGQRDG